MIKIMYVQDGGRQTKQMSDPLLQTYIKWLVSKTACPPPPKKKYGIYKTKRPRPQMQYELESLVKVSVTSRSELKQINNCHNKNKTSDW